MIDHAPVLCDFSEFTYGFAFTHEATKVVESLLPGPPTLPNLYDEGLLGYDMRMDGLHGWTLFVQFKIPEVLTRSNASEWQRWGSKYFRFATRTQSDQHDRLLELEQESVFHAVFYASPCFVDTASLSAAFSASMIDERSLKIRPSEIGPGAHVVSFIATGEYEVHSEPRSGYASPRERAFSNLVGLRTSIGTASRRLDASYFDELSSRILVHADDIGGRELVSTLASEARSRRTATADRSETTASFAALAVSTRLLFDGQLIVVPDLAASADEG